MDERLKDIRESNETPDVLSALPLRTSLCGGRYVIEKVLGKGGFGITYLAEDTQSRGAFEESEVVVKELFVSGGETLSCTRQGRTVIPTGHRRGDYSDFIEKFDGEAKMLHKYKGVPGVVKVTDLFGENDTAYFVMSYIKGRTLQAMIANDGPLSLDRTRVILESLVQTLGHLHRDEVLHRDIKPENIMITESEAVYLIDFGLAKAFISGKTRVDTGMHTPRYASPEQIIGRSVKGSASPDIYSLAATAYSILTGKLPQTTDERHLDGYIPVSAVVPSLSSHVDSAITRGMAIKYAERQSSVAAFYEEFVGSGTASGGYVSKSLDDDVTSVGGETVMDAKQDAPPTVDPRTGLSWITVEGGEYEMGCKAGRDDINGYECSNWEKPLHRVRVESFKMSQYAVTNAQYAQFLNAIGVGSFGTYSKGGQYENKEYIKIPSLYCKISYSGGRFVVDSGYGHYPVVEVSWYGARNYSKWVGGRLPSEEEWEYAARGGNKSKGYQFAGSNEVEDVAWYNENSGDKTHAVGGKSANELGLYDMNGNVEEWCESRYGSYNDKPSDRSSGNRVLRGGSWYDDAGNVRVSNRSNGRPTDTINSYGFRPVLSIP